MADVSISPVRAEPPTKWFVLSAVSLVFFFLNLSTFQSLGVVLFTMANELHWSMKAAGFSFTFLGLACGLSSPLPGGLMERIGGRATVFIGSILLVAGFALCARIDGLFSFYVALTLVGIGYSFAGNVPGVYLITGWFQQQSARMIGFYLMLGALGASVAPPIVGRIVRYAGWRGHWFAMAALAAVVGVLCLVLIRNAKRPTLLGASSIPEAIDFDPASDALAPRQAVVTSQFLLVAAAMASTMACVTTISAVVVFHLVKLGATADTAEFVFSALALTATLVKAVSGWMCERVKAEYVCSAGLVLQAAGIALLAYAINDPLRYTAALIFGIGWGFTYVAGTVVLIDYFGRRTGSKILSVVWFLTSIAAAGPPLAGWVADVYGTFAPVLDLFAAISFALAIPIWIMHPPVSTSALATQSAGKGLAGNVEPA